MASDTVSYHFKIALMIEWLLISCPPITFWRYRLSKQSKRENGYNVATMSILTQCRYDVAKYCYVDDVTVDTYMLVRC